MFAEFMIRAFLSGLGVAILTGVLGCFVIWRRMVYFGDALSHAAILGVVGAIALNVSVYFGVIALALILSVLLFTLTSRMQGADVILGVFAQTGLALGLIGASIWGRGLSIEAILFGDILAVGWRDIMFIIPIMAIKDMPMAVLKASLSVICLDRMMVSRIIDVIRPLKIAKLIIAQTGQAIPVN